MTPSAAQCIHDMIDPEAVARECLEVAAGDRKEAAELLCARVATNPRLKASLMESYTETVAQWLIQRIAPSAPRAATTNARKEPDGVGLARLAIANTADLLTTYVPSTGQPLGNVTRVELTADADHHRKQAADHLVHYSFLKAVAAKLPHGVRVANALTNNHLMQLLNQANAEVRS